MDSIKQQLMARATELTSHEPSSFIQPISDRDCEAIQGGKHDQQGKPSHAKDGKLKPWKDNPLFSGGLGSALVINIYQINLAINTILGSNGSSIVTMQGNNSATA